VSLTDPVPPAASSPIEVTSASLTGAPLAELQPMTVVMPVLNEKPNIVYLLKTLMGLRERLAGRYRMHFSIVDDGSTDGTWEEIQARFTAIPDVAAHRHPENRGIAAAILTGIRNAPTEIVCSIDCDCSYDPAVLEDMLPLVEHADLVTASPYHPRGQAVNVPGWRLFLSRSLSRIYSLILGDRIHTFTSCCRVYRKTVIAGLQLKYDDFLGIAEMLIRARLAGARIVEHPATLEARLFGASKMKTARTIRRHIKLIRELLSRRQADVKVPRRSSIGG
jgi:glycosyltransferase involved in cell wall biosynthesis